MTEANDLFEKLIIEIRPFIGPYENIAAVFSKKEEVYVFDKIEAYGKAEFGRGFGEGLCERVSLAPEPKYITNNYVDVQAYVDKCIQIAKKNIQLKEENKELMRENVELKKKVDEKEYFDYINDVHNRAMKNSLDELKQAVEDGCSQYEEIFKKKFGCDPFDYRFPCVSADEIFEAKEPEWHEYKKRLPLPNKATIVKWRYADE